MRGYGRTSPSPVGYEDDLRPFGTINKIKDMLALVFAMGYPPRRHYQRYYQTREANENT